MRLIGLMRSGDGGGACVPPAGPLGLEVLEPRVLLAGALSAEFVWVDNTAALSGFTSADLEVTTDTDWTSASLLIRLTQGSIYQDANGSVRAPDPALFGGMPTLEFDTYVSADNNSIFVAGAAIDVGGDTFQFDGSEIDILWFDTASDDLGTVGLGRFTLSDDAVGTWALRVVNAGSEVFQDTGSFTAGGLAAAPTPAPDGDFTGDGLADIVWRDTRNGRNSVWRMNGTDFVEKINIRRRANTDWKLVATGDFTGDGKDDILWRNTADGRNTVWEMNGTAFVGSTAIKELKNFSWDLGGVGDFTGDGKDDILWRNKTNGRNVVWEMNGTAYQGVVPLMTFANLKWQAVGVADLTGDGKDDILWRHKTKGRNKLWEMDGSTFQSVISFKRLGNTTWQFAGLGDYTGDGKQDILWRKTDTGANMVWQMDDTVFQLKINLQDETNLNKQPVGPLLGLWEP